MADRRGAREQTPQGTGLGNSFGLSWQPSSKVEWLVSVDRVSLAYNQRKWKAVFMSLIEQLVAVD